LKDIPLVMSRIHGNQQDISGITRKMDRSYG
jgi:hypothetical protein